jgi:hypothetical protein
MPCQHKALTKLLGLQFKIVYNKGLDNRVADAFSRNPTSGDDHFMALSQSTPVWLEEVAASYLQNEKAQKTVSHIDNPITL